MYACACVSACVRVCARMCIRAWCLFIHVFSCECMFVSTSVYAIAYGYQRLDACANAHIHANDICQTLVCIYSNFRKSLL